MVHKPHEDKMDFFVLVSIDAVLAVLIDDVLAEVGYFDLLEGFGAGMVRFRGTDTVLSCDFFTVLPELDESLQALQTFVDVDFPDAGKHGSIGLEAVGQEMIGIDVVEKGFHDLLRLLGVVEPFPGECAVLGEAFQGQVVDLASLCHQNANNIHVNSLEFVRTQLFQDAAASPFAYRLSFALLIPHQHPPRFCPTPWICFRLLAFAARVHGSILFDVANAVIFGGVFVFSELRGHVEQSVEDDNADQLGIDDFTLQKDPVVMQQIVGETRTVGREVVAHLLQGALLGYFLFYDGVSLHHLEV